MELKTTANPQMRPAHGASLVTATVAESRQGGARPAKAEGPGLATRPCDGRLVYGSGGF